MTQVQFKNNSSRSQNYEDYQNRNNEKKTDDLDDLTTNSNDGKVVRKAVFRRTIDYNSPVSLFLEQTATKRKYSPRNLTQPDTMYQHLMTPPMDYKDNPINCVCANHVRTSTNKNKCPIYVVNWTPDGRRLITGASSGEFTLWNGLTFNFETILQAHDTKIRAMKWSNNEEWLISADELGFVKYWQANMNDVNVFQAHKDSVRGLSFCPSDKKFVTCSNDNTVRVWDFHTSTEERVLRGHGADVTCVAWHSIKSLVFSGSKDCQQPIKLWDPKAGECISTMHVHKSACTDIRLNKNGNWFLTASKDHSIKLFDIRNLKKEMQIFRGHQKDVTRVAWHPYHETLFASGSMDGALLYWLVGTEMEVESVEDAHENTIWSLDWHPIGHIIASGSNDFATKFWTRNRPGDTQKESQDEKSNVLKHETRYKSKISEETKFPESDVIFHIDIDELSSEIQAEIELNDKLNDENTENEDDKDINQKGSVNRVIPKQFIMNWENNKSIPLVFNKEPSVLLPQPINSILQNLAPIINIPQPLPVPIMPVPNLLPPVHMNFNNNFREDLKLHFNENQLKMVPCNINTPNFNIPQMQPIRSGYQNFPNTPQIPFVNQLPNFRPERFHLNDSNESNFQKPQQKPNQPSQSGSFINRNQNRFFRPDFIQNNDQNRNGFIGNRQNINQNRRNNNYFNNSQQNPQQDNNENPFEPSKETGSSQSFIRLTPSQDGHHINRNNTRLNHRQGAKW